MITVRAGPMSSTQSGPKSPHPEHVEDDVEQAAVQPRRAQERPPGALHEHRDTAPLSAEQQQRALARRRGIDMKPPPIDLQLAARDEQRQRRTATDRGADRPAARIRDRRRAAAAAARIPRGRGSRGRTCSTCRRGRRRAIRTTGQTTEPVVLRRWQHQASDRSGSTLSPASLFPVFGRMFDARIRLRRRMLDGVTSTSSSSLMNSIACSRPSLRGGTRRIASSARRRAHVGLLLFLA